MFRLIIAVDIEAKTLPEAYEILFNKMNETKLGWESTDEAYDENGDSVDPDDIQEAHMALWQVCKLCSQPCLLRTAHIHQGDYIGDECCWDDRLKASE